LVWKYGFAMIDKCRIQLEKAKISYLLLTPRAWDDRIEKKQSEALV